MTWTHTLYDVKKKGYNKPLTVIILVLVLLKILELLINTEGCGFEWTRETIKAYTYKLIQVNE
jgi:hypothetical protein